MPPTSSTEPAPKDRSDLAPTSLSQLTEDISRLSIAKGRSTGVLQDGQYETSIEVDDGEIQIISLVIDESVESPEDAGVDFPRKGTAFLFTLQAQLSTTHEPIESLMVIQTGTQLSFEAQVGASMRTVDTQKFDEQQRKAIQDAIILSFYQRYGINDIKSFLDTVNPE